jgi:hypothetical protein
MHRNGAKSSGLVRGFGIVNGVWLGYLSVFVVTWISSFS